MKRRKRPNKGTLAYKAWELKVLKKRCLRLWSNKVRELAGNKCVVCGVTKQVHAHHIEDSRLNSGLRYDLRNGIAVCATHHKFGQESFHKSFTFAYKYIIDSRRDDLDYLLQETERKVDLTKEYLESKIKELKGE